MIRKHLLAVRLAVTGILAMGGAGAFAQGAPPAEPDATPPVSAEESLSPGEVQEPQEPGLDTEDDSSEAPLSTAPASPGISTSGAGNYNNNHTDPPSLVEEDVEPTITVFRSRDVQVRIGALVQVHVAPWVGADSLVANDDIATEAGFRLRRARFALEGHFHQHLRVLLAINPLESDPDVATVADANISFQATPWLLLRAGTDKVPFTRAGLESSSQFLTIENPLIVRTLQPDRRLGVTAEGEVLSRRLAYLVSFMNGTEGYELGNRFGGFLYAARLQFLALGDLVARLGNGVGLALGAGGLFEDGPATHGVAVSADVLMTMDRAVAKLEVLCDRITPRDSPIISPGIADAIDRCGGYLEIGYTLPWWSLQPVLRAELFDDDRAVQDAGDAILVSAGVNVSYHRHARLQLHYLHRRERFSNERQNDALVLNIQGEL
jgi:hypothetical protein